MRLLLITSFLVGALVATRADAQIPRLPTIGPNWIGAGYPKLFYTSREGLVVGLYYEQILPPGFEDWSDPPPYRAKLSIDGQLSTSGSRWFRTEARMPNLVPGWRFLLSFDAQRLAREGYFGVGNDTEFDRDNVTEGQKHFYRSDVRRVFVRGEVQRRIVSDLRVLVGFHAERWRMDTLPGRTLLALDNDPNIGIGTNEMTARFGLVFDTRDDEVTPSGGVLIQALLGRADASVAGDVTYTNKIVSAAAYVPVSDKVTLAGRVLGQSMTGSPPLGSLYRIDASDRAFGGVGGSMSHRGFARHRFLGPHKLISNFDVRYRAAGQRQVVSVSLIGFVDAGRVFTDGGFRLTTNGMHVGGGSGVVATIGRAGVLGLSFGVSDDGLRPYVHSRWSF